MFRSLLIANRGEIACRVIATTRRLGIRSIAVYSDADARARHVRLADQAVRLGPAAARESYLSVEKVIAAARSTGAEAVHPGYGFLSENAELAEACAASGIVFVGPSPSAIRAMGSKSTAKSLMEKFEVPLTPGYHGESQDPARLAAEAERIGYPVLIKASAGGGGKGMRRVNAAADFSAALASCQRESAGAFGSDRVLIERYIEGPRHIELQIFGDSHGNYVHLFERDCSVQRRHQKVLEEAPAPGMTAERRAAMGRTALQAARAVGYVGAGTVEFIVDPAGVYYFMEMNTRLQVEHPVTEAITGLDLVEWQLRVASGEALPLRQEQLAIHGHAIEARIYAEDPDAGFLPSMGTLTHLRPPLATAAVRIDTGVEQGDEISAHYDPMIAKLIVWGTDRNEALGRLQSALAAYEIVGVVSNVDFLGRLVRTRSFSEAKLDTALLEREQDALQPPPKTPPEFAWLLAAAAELERRGRVAAQEHGGPWAPTDGWRMGGESTQIVALRIGDETRELLATFVRPGEYALKGAPGVRFERRELDRLQVWIGDHALRVTTVFAGARLSLFLEGRRWEVAVVDPLDVGAEPEVNAGGLRAPMPGKVVTHLVKEGAKVQKGTALMVLEAMKMELTISAPLAGVLVRFFYGVGEQVSEGAELAQVEAEAAGP